MHYIILLITGRTGFYSLFHLLFQFALAPKFGLLDFQDLLRIEILSEPSDQNERRWFGFGRRWRWSQYVRMKTDYHVSWSYQWYSPGLALRAFAKSG
jgi:hypothetical protein